MHDKKKIKIGKVFNLFLILIFYNTIIYAINIFFGNIDISRATLTTFVKTFISGGPWFIIVYSILYLIIPYINIVLKSCNKKQLQILISIMLIFFCIWPTFISDATVKDSGYGIINFIMLYLIGAYISIYKKDEKNKKIRDIFIYVLMSIITYICSIKSFGMAFDYNSIFNIVGSTALFLIFKDLKFKSKFINKLASHTLAVYIMHINTFMRPILWKKILHCDLFYTSKFFIIHLIGSIIFVYAICIVIDIIRSKIFETLIDKKLNKTKIYNYEIGG